MRNNRAGNIEPFLRLSVKLDNHTGGADERLILAQGKPESSSEPQVHDINYTHRRDNTTVLIPFLWCSLV